MKCQGHAKESYYWCVAIALVPYNKLHKKRHWARLFSSMEKSFIHFPYINYVSFDMYQTLFYTQKQLKFHKLPSSVFSIKLLSGIFSLMSASIPQSPADEVWASTDGHEHHTHTHYPILTQPSHICHSFSSLRSKMQVYLHCTKIIVF